MILEEIEKCQANGDWDEALKFYPMRLEESLEKTGADYIVICYEYMQKLRMGK